MHPLFLLVGGSLRESRTGYLFDQHLGIYGLLGTRKRTSMRGKSQIEAQLELRVVSGSFDFGDFKAHSSV